MASIDRFDNCRTTFNTVAWKTADIVNYINIAKEASFLYCLSEIGLKESLNFLLRKLWDSIKVLSYRVYINLKKSKIRSTNHIDILGVNQGRPSWWRESKRLIVKKTFMFMMPVTLIALMDKANNSHCILCKDYSRNVLDGNTES